MTNKLWIAGLAIVGVSLTMSVSADAAITKMKLADIVPGTEVVTLVDNGDFEDNTSGNDFDANGWGRFGNMFFSLPTPLTGTQAARAHVDGGGANGYFRGVTTLLPNTDYVLSGYMAHLGDINHGGRAELDLFDAPYEPNDGVMGGGSISISQLDEDANDGYFVYGTFTTDATNLTPSARLFIVVPNGTDNSNWPNQPVGALWDNIAITPASLFVPPTLIPEPSSIALLVGCSLVGLVRRRK